MTPLEWVGPQTAGTVYGKALLYVICAGANAAGALATTEEQLAWFAEMSVDSVRHHLRELQRRGLLRYDLSGPDLQAQLPASATAPR